MSDPNRPYIPSSLPAFIPSGFQEYAGSESQEWALGGYAISPFTPQPPVNGFASHIDDPASRTLTGERSLHLKVAIPRYANASSWTSSGRVSRACENCREQKAKCSGHRPSCQRCQEADIRCSYGDRKREKTAKLLNDLTNQVQVYESLLRDIYPKLDAQSMELVDRVINADKRESDPSNRSQTPALASSSSGAGDGMNSAVPANAAPVSPLAAMDYTDEDFNRDEKVQAIGFVGEHSEISWLYRLKRELEQELPVATHSAGVSSSNQDLGDRLSVSSMTYFLDTTEFPVMENVDTSERPPQELADQLVERYFQLVYPPFPIIARVIFIQQYKSFYANPFVRPGKRWLAILNLVFAIAARYSQLLQDEADAKVDDHSVYFSRAWKLSMSDVALLDHPNLQQVQVEGLTSFYLLCIGQINRSWRISGISIRSAFTMGLNLRNESSSVVHVSKEVRCRVWWALYALDTTLCAMTGRPPSTIDEFCTTPLPVPFKEEDFWNERVAQIITDHEARSIFMGLISSHGNNASADNISSPHTAGVGSQAISKGKQAEKTTARFVEYLPPSVPLWFLHFVNLTLLMRQVIGALYAPGAARRSWSEQESIILDLHKKTESWLGQLPVAFQFQTNQASNFREQILNLAFRFYSTRIILCQPCLRRCCRQVPGAAAPDDFCLQIAQICVDSACEMVDLLPAVLDADWLFGSAPWWCILHYIMQAVAVLLIELFSTGRPRTDKTTIVLQNFHKAVVWLQVMSRKDPSSHRAWQVCTEIYNAHAARLGFNIELRN